MTHLHNVVRCGAWALAVSMLLTACSDYVPPQSEPPAPPAAEVQGIATPSSVAVVTATHAE